MIKIHLYSADAIVLNHGLTLAAQRFAELGAACAARGDELSALEYSSKVNLMDEIAHDVLRQVFPADFDPALFG